MEKEKNSANSSNIYYHIVDETLYRGDIAFRIAEYKYLRHFAGLVSAEDRKLCRFYVGRQKGRKLGKEEE